MLITILGNLGSGKTLFMVITAFYSKRKIVSNFKINFPERIIEPFNLNWFIQAKYENCILLLDEAYTYLESRVSSNELNRIMSYILFQSRKKNVELYITAQLLSTIDKRYRELSDYFVLAKRNENENFVYCIYMKESNSVIVNEFDYLKVLPFFQMYNTNEVILTNDRKILFDTKESEQKEEEISLLANQIEEFYFAKNLLNITKSMINLYAISHNIPKFLVESIFAEIKIRKKIKEKV